MNTNNQLLEMADETQEKVAEAEAQEKFEAGNDEVRSAIQRVKSARGGC